MACYRVAPAFEFKWLESNPTARRPIRLASSGAIRPSASLRFSLCRRCFVCSGAPSLIRHRRLPFPPLGDQLAAISSSTSSSQRPATATASIRPQPVGSQLSSRSRPLCPTFSIRPSAAALRHGHHGPSRRRPASAARRRHARVHGSASTGRGRRRRGSDAGSDR